MRLALGAVRTRWGSFSVPPDPLVAIGGRALLLRGMEGRGGEGREGEGKGTERKPEREGVGKGRKREREGEKKWDKERRKDRVGRVNGGDCLLFI